MANATITLADAYLGNLDGFFAQSFKDFAGDRRTREKIEEYLELMEEFPPRKVEEEGAIPEALMEKLKSGGFFGLSIPERYGGSGFDIFQYLAMVEVAASQSMAVGLTVLAHLSIGAKGIVLFGNERQKEKYLPQAASGETVFSYALTEPETGSDAKSIRTAATFDPDNSEYLLDGVKTYITNANYAGAMTVFARLESGKLGAFIVETGWDGVKVGKELPKMGLKASSTATVRFENVRVPRANLLGEEGEGFRIAMIVLNHGRLALGATSSGKIALSLGDMMKRASQRKQFGVPIASFDLVKEKLVKAGVYGEVASAMTAMAAGVLHRDELAPAAVETSHCKMFGTSRAWDVLYDALQTAGGAGYLKTLPYEMRMRDFRVATIFEGTEEIHSVYPALFIARKISDRLFSKDAGPVEKLSRLAKIVFPGALPAKNRELKPYCRLAARLIGKMAAMTVYGLIRYGRGVENKQFLLRRISLLSLYGFALMSMISKTEAMAENGEEPEDFEDRMAVLRWFAREARDCSRNEAGWFAGLRDGLNDAVFGGIGRRLRRRGREERKNTE